MTIKISIVEDDSPDMKIVYTASETEAETIPIMPVILGVLKFMEHQLGLCDRLIRKRHPFLNNFTPAKQDELIRAIHSTATIADLNPKKDTNSSLKIIVN